MPTSLTSTPSSSCSSDTLIPIINFMAYHTIEDAITVKAPIANIPYN